jgi:hypothetical protein
MCLGYLAVLAVDYGLKASVKVDPFVKIPLANSSNPRVRYGRGDHRRREALAEVAWGVSSAGRRRRCPCSHTW